MTHGWNVRLAGLAIAAIASIGAFGCSKSLKNLPIPNIRPTVTLTSAPVDTRDTSFYAYKIDWSGYDPDGRVDHFIYSIDPTPTDTVWTITTKNEETKFFRSTRPVLGGIIGNPIRSVDRHTFVIKAVDNSGAFSAPAIRVFYSYTVAPSVNILNPHPSSDGVPVNVSPAMRISWNGIDPDGQTRQKPVKYKYKLLPKGNTEFDISYAVTNAGPDSLRNFYEKTNFAGWDSIGGDTTTIQYTGLTPNQVYLFVIIGIDEAGAFNADFALSSNMLTFQVGFAGNLGPKITVFNEFYIYTMSTGGFAPNNPAAWQHLEIPAGTRVTFNWSATPPPGADIEAYRWRVNGDVADETERTNETTDWYHWSQWALSTTSCTIGPFNTPEERTLYIEARDNSGLLSLLTIKLKPVVPTLDRPLLVVNDTRREVDQFTQPGNISSRKNYGDFWPSASELDTFLFARGGYPWKMAYTNVNSPPGIFAKYGYVGDGYDTLGTRLGYQNQTNGVPFSYLSKYKHIIWMVDHYGGTYPGTNSAQPMATLHYMCVPGHNNTFSTYTYAGGKMWLLGGAAANASLTEFNATGGDNNDRDYSGISCRVYAGPGYAHHVGKEELQPGRLMFDGAKWQSLMVFQTTTGRINVDPNLFTNLNRKWVDQPGYNYANPVHRPDYTQLPATFHTHTNPASDPVNGEPVPPTRQTPGYNGSWWTPSLTVDLEYLAADNFIIEDMNPDAVRESLEVALDSLYYATGANLVTDRYTGREGVVMTWYHGVASPEFIFTGFAPWLYRRSDCQSLFDFVMQQIWGFPVIHAPFAVARPATAPARVAAPAASSGSRVHLPIWHSGGK
jgi:hypothetical protein